MNHFRRYLHSSIALLVIGCLSTTNLLASENSKFESFEVTLENDVILSINPLIEFFQVFNLLAGNPNVNSIDTDYKSEIFSYFEAYRDHPSLEFYRNNHGNYFNSIDAPYLFLHSINDNFEFRPQLIENKWINHNNIDQLLEAFKKFSNDTNFHEFFNSQSKYYSLLIDNHAFILNDFEEKQRMLSYYGIPDTETHKFFIILNVLGMGNFGSGVSTKEAKEHYAVISPGKSISGIPILHKSDAEALIWHEFGHSFTNPIVDKYWEELEVLSHLHSPIEATMKGQSYPEWKTVLYEHMTRATTSRFEALKYGELLSSVSNERLELGKKYIYLNPIVEQLKYYETNRKLYPTLQSFMPVIISKLEEVTEEEISNWIEHAELLREPNVSDIPNNMDAINSNRAILIYSTSESDIIAHERLQDYLAGLFPNMLQMADTTALKSDLSENNLFVIGTYNGNEFIKKYSSSIPIYIDQDQLIAGKKYLGSGHVFMTGWVHPQNSEKSITYYIAQNPNDLINIGWVRRGSTDYHIVKNLITLKADNYNHFMNMWRIR